MYSIFVGFIYCYPCSLFQLISITLFTLSFGIFLFTLLSVQFQRFYMPASFLCVFILCTVTLLIFSDKSGSFMSPVGDLATSFQVTFSILSSKFYRAESLKFSAYNLVANFLSFLLIHCFIHSGSIINLYSRSITTISMHLLWLSLFDIIRNDHYQ